MILKAIIDDQEYSLNVPDAVLAQGEEFFDRLDKDMDKGWQMSREWVANPTAVERCQIVADKLLTALENENDKLGMLMAGYILKRMPQVEAVEIDIQGEIQNTQFTQREQVAAAEAPQAPGHAPALTGAQPAKLSKLEALEQAGNDITKVFKVGKGYRFSVFDAPSGAWQDSPLIATEEEADRLRQQAYKERFQALHGGD